MSKKIVIEEFNRVDAAFETFRNNLKVNNKITNCIELDLLESLVKEVINNYEKYQDSQQDLIKGKDEYIAKLCNDRAELKAELKDLKDACEKSILKNKVICNVNLHYYLNKKSEIFNKLKTISNRLEEYHIQSDIVVGNHWGECWEFSAKGTTTLEIAEYICNFIRSQDLHAKIGYDDSHEFYLSA